MLVDLESQMLKFRLEEKEIRKQLQIPEHSRDMLKATFKADDSDYGCFAWCREFIKKKIIAHSKESNIFKKISSQK